MTDQLDHLLDQIDRLDQEATKGPWTSIGNDCGGKVYEPSGYPLPGCTSCGENEATYEGQDAEFIALARTALPALAQAVKGVLDVLDGHPAPRKEADPTGYATARIELLEHRVREAIQEAIGDDDA